MGNPTLDQLAVVIGTADLGNLSKENVFYAEYYNTPYERTGRMEFVIDLSRNDIAIIKLKKSIDFEGKHSKGNSTP